MLLATLARLLLYIGITLAAGHTSLRIFRIFARAGTPVADTHRVVRFAWCTLWIAVLLLLVAQASALELGFDPASYTELLRDTSWGHAWLLLAAGILAGHAAFAWRWPLTLQGLTIVLIAVAMGGLGHAAADDAWPIASRVLDALHVLGVGAWIGGLFYASRFAPHEHQADAWSAFSRVATAAAPVVVLTGFGATLRRLNGATVGVALASDYGRLLLIKLVLAAVVLVFGAVHRQRTVERRLPGALGVHAELAFAALVFLVTGVLTGMAPPGE